MLSNTYHSNSSLNNYYPLIVVEKIIENYFITLYRKNERSFNIENMSYETNLNSDFLREIILNLNKDNNLFTISYLYHCPECGEEIQYENLAQPFYCNYCSHITVITKDNFLEIISIIFRCTDDIWLDIQNSSKKDPSTSAKEIKEMEGTISTPHTNQFIETKLDLDRVRASL